MKAVLAKVAFLQAKVDKLEKKGGGAGLGQRGVAEAASIIDRPPPGQFGESFNYLGESLNKEEGVLSTRLPPGLWSAALIAPLAGPPDQLGQIVLFIAIPVYIGLAFAVVAQCTLIYYVASIRSDESSDGGDGFSCTSGGDFLCRAVCL